MMWNSVQIARTCLRTRMRDPRRNPDIPFLYVDISAIDRSLKVITSAPEILGADAPSRARKEIREGDILVSTVRPNLNAVAVVPQHLDGQIASTGFCVLRPNKSAIVGKYLFYFTTTPNFVGILSGKVRGAHYPAVSDSDVKEIELPLPTVSEQRRIVEILDQADALRNKRVEADAKAARILPALFYKMFGDPATNPKGWHKGVLGDVIAEVQYGTSVRADADGKGVAVIRMNNINASGGMDLTDIKYADLSENERKHYALEPGDILFNRTNSKELVGKTGLWRGEVLAVAASYLIRVRVDLAQVRPEFIWTYMNSRYIKQVLFDKCRRAIGMANINAKELRALPLIIPPRQMQQAFVTQLEHAESLVKRGGSARVKLERLFSVLLHRAFTGDLTAKWREAHMKELLQEMEQQAKELKIDDCRSQIETDHKSQSSIINHQSEIPNDSSPRHPAPL